MLALPPKFRPMLSGRVDNDGDIDKLDFVKNKYIASPKLDGIRVLIHPVLGPVTRTLKRVPNHFVQEAFSGALLKHLAFCDGEMTYGPPAAANSPAVFNKTSSVLMSFFGTAEVTYQIFDTFHPEVVDAPYSVRMAYLQQTLETPLSASIHYNLLQSREINSKADLIAWEEFWVSQGYEGLMLRHMGRGYKFGRSSINASQQHLMKFKRFEDAEAVIIGFEELMHNENKAEADAFGLTERSSKMENLIPGNTLGALHVKVLNGRYKDVNLHIGTGFDQDLRKLLWLQQADYLGKMVTFKYQPHGSVDAPRFPVFKGFRDQIDAEV